MRFRGTNMSTEKAGIAGLALTVRGLDIPLLSGRATEFRWESVLPALSHVELSRNELFPCPTE